MRRKLVIVRSWSVEFGWIGVEKGMYVIEGKEALLMMRS
jgi:hypothetical protein